MPAVREHELGLKPFGTSWPITTPACRSVSGSKRRKHSNRRTRMPRFIIQREYLLSVYHYEADTFEEARAEAAGPGHDWYNAEEDYDGSLPTTITNAKMVPEGATTDHYLIEGGPRQQSGAHPRESRGSRPAAVCVRHGLSAGGKWIRTIGPASKKWSMPRSSDQTRV